MKKKIFVIILVLTIIIFIYFYAFKNKPNVENLSNGREVTKEDYIYKDNLLDLGYNINEIKVIEKKISNINTKKFLLSKKYNNLTKFISSPYFNINNIERYENYYKNNPNYSIDDVVIYVEIGLDNEFYTNIKEIDNYLDVTALVNKYNKLPDNIVFDDLNTLDKRYSNDGTKQLRSEAYDAVIDMIEAAKRENINLLVISAYRTSERQNSLFNNSVNKNGMEHALLYSAKSGHSEHQLGLAVDFNTTQESFEKTKEFEWLKNNAYKYGFILRYPKGKEFITGYGYEPWHYRYVGIDIATKIFKENITYEEYIVKFSNKSYQ